MRSLKIAMLVLSRKVGETIMIGDEIEVILTRIERDTVRLAIKAPKSVRIFRGELCKDGAIPAENPPQS